MNSLSPWKLHKALWLCNIQSHNSVPNEKWKGSVNYIQHCLISSMVCYFSMKITLDDDDHHHHNNNGFLVFYLNSRCRRRTKWAQTVRWPACPLSTFRETCSCGKWNSSSELWPNTHANNWRGKITITIIVTIMIANTHLQIFPITGI